MNKLQRMLTGITILTALAGCSTVDNRPIVTYRELQENPGCYNLFEYRLPDKEASDIRGSTKEEYFEAHQDYKRNRLPSNRK